MNNINTLLLAVEIIPSLGVVIFLFVLLLRRTREYNRIENLLQKQSRALIEPFLQRELLLTTSLGKQSSAGDELTDRERDVLRLVARGEPTRRIAGQLGISRETVETHIRAGMRKLGARTRTEAAALALEELA